MMNFIASPLLVVTALDVFGGSKGWVMTDVDFPSLRGKGLDTDANDLDAEDLAGLRFSLIYPGTNWCGAGNVAVDYDDLGPARETDKCCREHDMCPDVIPAGEAKYNLTNEVFYSRLSCKCDDQFHLCLRNAKSKISKQIGIIYFNALSTQCFREDYPVVGCRKRGGWLNSKCLEPEYDAAGKRLYQWFDVPNY